jgi:hypothetical protein
MPDRLRQSTIRLPSPLSICSPDSPPQTFAGRTSALHDATPHIHHPVVDLPSYPAQDLLRVIADVFTQITATNDRLSLALASPTGPSPSTSTRRIWDTLTSAARTTLATPAMPHYFHARTVPLISIHEYLVRIHRYCPAPNHVFVALLVYFDRLDRLAADATGYGFVVDSFNIHRLIIAGFSVASKVFTDVFYTNDRYAKVGGVTRAELNQIELQFVLLNDFRLRILEQEMQHYAEQLVHFSPSATASLVIPLTPSVPSTVLHIRTFSFAPSTLVATSFAGPTISAALIACALTRTPSCLVCQPSSVPLARSPSRKSAEVETKTVFTSRDVGQLSANAGSRPHAASCRSCRRPIVRITPLNGRRSTSQSPVRPSLQGAAR